MAGVRNLDEELDAHLAGASIPEDDVELDTEENMGGGATERLPPDESPGGWSVVDQAPLDNISILQTTKSVSRGKKFAVRLLISENDVCMTTISEPKNGSENQ
jgi:hypothetical protein